ncbi:MAG: heavy metal translocating P-type ATPase [Clostridia bacterium]|nr:heavy metal translocating P-type ATPase [Clostridia bacterium]
MKTQFDVTGMTCASCSARVQKSVESLSGAKDVQVNLLTNSMSVEYDEKQITASDIIMKVKSVGYGCEIKGKSNSNAAADKAEKKAKIRLILSVVLLIPLMYVSMGHMFHFPQPAFLTGHENALNFAIYQLVFTLVILVINYKYFTIGFKSLFRFSPNMDSLIAIGAAASFIYGIVGTVKIASGLSVGDMELVAKWHSNLYFESAAMIVTLVDIGKFLEERSKGKTKAVLDMLTSLAPETATVIRDGKESVIPAEEVSVGDEILVRPGTKIPTDGVVLSGNGFVDQSALTGESMPVQKEVGDNVLCASINTSGAFTMKATKVGSSTTLSQMIALSLEAAGSKAPISRLADKVSRVFVPTVISIAVLCGIIWYIVSKDFSLALNFAISVLVISCPCALGLATPVAIMVGTGQGAKNGLLFKSAAAMERLSQIDTAVFDKTGTLTKGEPSVTDIISLTEMTESDMLTVAAAMEKNSEHPLARAILKKAKDLPEKTAEEFSSFSGGGISAKIDGKTYFAGNERLLSQNGIDCSSIGEKLNGLANEGKTPLLFASDGKVIGIIAVADSEKENSAFAIEALKRLGISSVMLTGDNKLTAKAVGERLGVQKIISEVLPQNKESEVRALQESGKVVAMVGDGINDAPALSRADVGIAIGDGTDIAVESADLVLMNKDIYSVVNAIRLSKKVLGNIKMNLFWAFFYNAVSIPLAAGVFYSSFGIKLSPMIAAGAMSLSSVCVVLNALRLRFFKAEKPASADSNNTNDKTGTNQTDSIEFKEDSDMKKIIEIEGMHCAHCAKAVEDELLAVNGVKKAKADAEKKNAVVSLAEDVSDDELFKAVEKAGFKPIKAEVKKGLFD